MHQTQHWRVKKSWKDWRTNYILRKATVMKSNETLQNWIQLVLFICAVGKGLSEMCRLSQHFLLYHTTVERNTLYLLCCCTITNLTPQAHKIKSEILQYSNSSSSIGTATVVGCGLLNYRWVFSAGGFLHSAVASGTSNPQLGGPVIRTFQIPSPGVPHAWNDASEPQ